MLAISASTSRFDRRMPWSAAKARIARVVDQLVEQRVEIVGERGVVGLGVLLADLGSGGAASRC